MKKSFFYLITISTILFSCTGSNQWSIQNQQQWMQQCQNQFVKQEKPQEVIREYCVCVMDKIQADFPSMKASLEMPEEKLKKYFDSCKQD